MTTPTTLPEALTEIEGLRGQVRELLRLLGQEAPQEAAAAGLSTSEITRLNGVPEIPFAQASLERKQTGRERTQIVAEGRNVIEIAPDIIFKLDLHGNLAGWNKRLETVTGFVPEELNSRPAVSFAPECEREQTAAAIRQAFEQGYAELEGHLLTKTGRMIPYHWTGATLENHLGHVIGLIGVGRDRTVLKHAEEALRTSEARFRELVETTTDWMWEINELGAYTYCSPKIREFLGYEPDEAIGKTPFDFMPPEEAHRVAALFGPIAAARKPFAGIENINRRKDGQLVTFECRGIPIFGADGSFRGYRGFDQDITRRKLFELQNRERLDSMIRFQEIQLRLHRQPFQDLTEGLRTILRMAANALSIERVGIWLFNDNRSSLICRELYQLSLNKFESGAVLDASRYPRYFDALDQSLPLAVNDVLTDPRTSEFTEDYFIPLGISSVMDVAVRRDGTIIGVVWFEHIGLKTEWSEEEQAFARSIGDHVALCLLDAERQQTEMTLRESEERFAAAVEGATDVLWDAQRIPGVPWHAPETPIWWSPRVRQLLGLENGESFDTLGQWVARLHPEDMDRVLSQLTAHIEHRVSYDVEYRLRTNHGEYRWMRGKGQAIWDEQGEPRRMSGSCQDISERKRVEAALQESESHFRAMIENSSDIITVLDLDGTIRFESPSFERLLGYAQHEIDGRIAFDFIHPDDLPTVIEKFQRIVQRPGETQTAEFRFRHQDGSWLILEGVGRATCDARSRSCVIVNSRDITERKRAERSLLQTRDLLTSFVENTPAAVAMLDRELRYVAVSRRWLTDYRLGDEPLLGRHHYDVFPEIQDMKEWQEIHQRSLSGSVERREEDRFVRADGSEDWLRWEVRPWHDVTGEIGGIIMFTEVITERKQAEMLLRSSQEKLQQALHASNTGLWDWNTETNEASLSPEWKRQLGYDEGDLPDVFETWESRLHPEDRARALAYAGDYLAHPEGEYRQEFRLRHKDGSYRWIEARASVITEPDGRRVRLLGSHTDITARKHTEEALHISQGRYARATAVGKVGVWELDVATGTYYGDVNLKALFGYDEDELSTDPYVWLDLVHPDDRSIAMEQWQRIVRGEADGYNYELRMVRKDGAVIWTDVRGHAVRNNEGQVKHLFGATVDITERKRTEQALREREGTLARFKATLDQVHDCVFMFAADSLCFVYCNRGAVMQVGYTEDELATMTPLDIKPEFSERAFREMLEPLRDGSCAVQVFETVHRHKDGHDVAVEVSLQFVGEAGQAGLFAAVVRDITERKHAQEALRLSEERFRSLFENSPIAYQSLDREGQFIDVNQRLCHLLGYEEEELIGRDFGDLWAGNLQGDFSATFEAFKKSGKVRNELALRRRDGTIVNAVIDGRIQRDQKGEFIRTHCILTDITERAQAEEALRRSEARLKEAQRIAHIGSWELDLVANRLTWSDEIYRIFEIDAEAFGASYEAFLQLVHPDDRSLVDRAYTESVTFRTPYNITHRLLMADGRIKFVREQCETQYGRDGLAFRSSGTVQDITKQKEAEEALAQNHTLLTAIMDASIDLISIKDLQGRYVHINRAGAEAVGMPAEAVIGWDDVALWGGAVAASRRASDRFVTESGQTITVEEQGTLLDDLAHYLTTKAPYRDSEGSIIGVIGIARNITKWKRVEEERQKALTLLTNVINATPDLIFVKDCDLRTILCNNSFAQAIGKTPEDLIGRSDIENGWDPELVKGNFDEGFPGYESDDRQALAGKVVHNPSDPVNVNGEVRIFDTYKVPLRNETGGVIGILGMSRDVTERKRMEEMLRQRERDVRAAIEERERISEDLHDGILQSIFAVGLGLESCRTLVAKLPRKKAATPLMAGLNRAIGQLNHVMTDVRNFIAGIESHVLEEADIGQTLRTMVQAMCASNGTACRVTIEEAAVRELSTEQAYHAMNVIREALSNSLRHSEAGRITLSFKRLRRSVRLSVTDNGKGFIPDSARDAGHGLINMSARARKLGGRIEVHSRPRQGTKVLLDIPGRPVDE